MVDLQLPTFRSPSGFRLIDGIYTGLQRSVDDYENEVKKIPVIERGNVQKYVVDKIKTIDRLDQLTNIMDKYIVCFQNNKHVLSMLIDKHKFPYAHSCVKRLSQWFEYLEKQESPKTPRSLDSS